MVKKLRNSFGNEKGFTLVELLAVIVILGIIAAIAVPAIGSIIGNTKDEAHNANAITMIEASRIAYASGTDTETVDTDKDGYYMKTLIAAGYLEGTPDNPDGGTYDSANSFVAIGTDGSTYTVTLKGTTGGGTAKTYVPAQTLSQLQDSNTSNSGS
ncbi:prepilin-type N-terminal cleavage/methylation domain-containing protein [Pontibacillus salicampi]|uniref:Prepilin-type N-terminal cleavage/methylation domain-containing protein n=1 Tax=Pontibacillus salicampi TaxID=1449801 RepID=A0ABV6LJG2_9BACI